MLERTSLGVPLLFITAAVLRTPDSCKKITGSRTQKGEDVSANENGVWGMAG